MLLRVTSTAFPHPLPLSRGARGNTVIRLEAAAPDGARRFLSALPVLALDGATPQSWVTLTRTGTFSDARYGEFEISRALLLAMVDNFNKGVYGQKIFIDVDHKPSNGAAGEVVELALDGGKLRANVVWTPYGVDAIKNRNYVYMSAEYCENWQDNESRAKHGPVLLGAALTIRPCIKHLDPVQLSMPDGSPPTLLHPDLNTHLLSEITTMWKTLIAALTLTLGSYKLSEAVVKTLTDACEKALGPVTDETAAKALIAAFETSGKQLAAQIGDRTVTLSINVPDLASGGMSEAQIRTLMETMRADDAKAAKTLTETLGNKVKLLSDTINAATGLDDKAKRELTDQVKDLVTATMTDDQVKQLAAVQITTGNNLKVARELAAQGFHVAGSPHISVDDSNSVKALQVEIDKRLGFAGLSDGKRYARTGGTLPEENKLLAEKVLAEYDARNAMRLRAEHKQLAGGDGLISDTAIPAIFERTVIREQLYSLVGLQFVDVGTQTFATSCGIPYSYRDTTAAGNTSTTVYEGGAIARAGVKQAMDTAYPIPQKIAFEVSDELRYLTAAGIINYDAVSENVRNAIRIIGENTEARVFNEVLNAADQYGTVAVVNEAVATADGTLTVFKLDHFPVVRPKLIYDLQGVQIGSTLYPVTVKSNSVTRTEYNGTGTQANGLYWTMDYNLGEVHFVDEAGVPEAPTNAHAVVVSYNYSTNVYAFDTDLGSDEIDEHWNQFLYRYGLRKAVIESDRYHMANFGLMSMTAMTQIEQAKQFSANFTRPGTDLSADGNLGRVKAVPNFKTTAPGLYMGDQRIVIGERNQTRFRMMKPWEMGQLQDQRDSNGRFTGKKEAYGDQFIVLHTPIPLKSATTSMLLYSSSARVDRA